MPTGGEEEEEEEEGLGMGRERGLGRGWQRDTRSRRWWRLGRQGIGVREEEGEGGERRRLVGRFQGGERGRRGSRSRRGGPGSLEQDLCQRSRARMGRLCRIEDPQEGVEARGRTTGDEEEEEEEEEAMMRFMMEGVVRDVEMEEEEVVCMDRLPLIVQKPPTMTSFSTNPLNAKALSSTTLPTLTFEPSFHHQR